jgi:hypothetical protein
MAGAAAKRRRMMLEKEELEKEEEEMAQYTQSDLDNDWEFKIVRSGTAAFRKPQMLEKLLEEESHAGWVMLEKLDDSRVRFKRPRGERAKDAYLPPDVDPYRTQYGAPTQQLAMVLTMIGLLVFLVLGIVAFVLASR